MADATQDDLDAMETRIRQGLGPDECLIDHLKDGEDVKALLDLPAGRAMLRECTQAAATYLRILTTEEPPDAETERKALLALRLNVGIIRRMALTVAMGREAEKVLLERDGESEF